eukprot:scaffold6241_cov129-Cylindrotheca_fusiformis.AAC.3
MSLKWSEEASTAAQELASGKSNDIDYVLFSVQNPKKPNPEVTLESKGKGGRKRVSEILSNSDCDSKIITGAFVASAVDERGSVSSVRRKIIHVTFAGSGVGVMVKGKVNGWSGNFRDPFPGCAIYLQLMGGDLDDIEEDTLEANLMSAGGAHKPTRYDFTNETLRGSLGLNESDNQSNAREEEEARIRAQAEAAKMRREKEAKKKAEEEAQKKAAEAARKKADAEAKRNAEEERKKAEAEAASKKRAKAEEAARKKREEEAARKKEEEEKKKAEADEAARKKRVEAEAAARKKREDEAAKKKAEEERRKAEEQVKLKAVAQKEKAEIEQNKLAAKDNDFVMLLSSQSGSNHQMKKTKSSKRILDSIGVKPVIVDGADPKEKQTRDELFRLSGVRGNYPQFFVKSQEGGTSFFGDFEVLDEKNKSGTLVKEIGGGSDKTKPEVPVQSSSDGSKKLILLISSMCTSQVKGEQNHAISVLEGLGVPTSGIEILDGCDTTIKDRRNQLWGISGIRAKYPQLFAVESDGKTISFVGDYEGIIVMHDHGSLAAAIGIQ